MSGFKHQLKAYLGEKHVATLGLLDNNEMQFFYQPDWQKNGFALSPYLPLDNRCTSDQYAIKVFFQNLFPEGENLDVLLQNYHLSRYNIFAMTQILGRDLPGALVLAPDEELPAEKSIFRKIQPNEIIERLSYYNPSNLLVWDGKPRLSLAGVHQKINVVVNEKGELGLGEGKLCSTHILKFEQYPDNHVVMNEYLMMKLAKMIGLNVAECELQYFGEFSTLLVTRFDRIWNNHLVSRRHVIDGCQALNLLPDYKYERNLGSGRDVKNIREGASLKKLFGLCNTCRNSALAKKELLEWTLFNLIIGNWDAHGKNISFFVSKNGIEVAPFYDLINIRIYPDFAQELSMAIGDEFDAASINAYQLADFAECCGLSRTVVANTLERLCHQIIRALPELNQLIQDHTFVERLIDDIRGQVDRLEKQVVLITEINV